MIIFLLLFISLMSYNSMKPTWFPSMQAISDRMIAALDWISSTHDINSWIRMGPALHSDKATRISSFSDMLHSTEAATDCNSSLSSFNNSTNAEIPPEMKRKRKSLLYISINNYKFFFETGPSPENKKKVSIIHCGI